MEIEWHDLDTGVARLRAENRRFTFEVLENGGRAPADGFFLDLMTNGYMHSCAFISTPNKPTPDEMQIALTLAKMRYNDAD